MTNKEEAQKLVDKFSAVGLQTREEGIECALICVDEWMEELGSWESSYMGNVRYLELKQVKQELEKL